MFRPNTTAKLYRRSAQLDLYGEQSFDTPVNVKCAVVTFEPKVSKSSVRVDSSGSHGRAEEEVTEAVLLFLPTELIAQGDIVEIDGKQIEAISIFPRRSTSGKLDHLEVSFRKGARPI